MSQSFTGIVGRFFAGLWRIIDVARRAMVNLLFVAIVLVVVLAFVGGGTPKLKERTVLVFDPSGPVVEQSASRLSDRVRNELRGESDHSVRLRDLLAVLDAAAVDPKIERVLLMLDDFDGAGLPSLREIVAAIDRVKAAGKQVVAWGSNYSQRQYFVAAHADEVYLHPMGGVLIRGFGGLRNYYKDALDQLGVSANVIRAGKFKNYNENYAANRPSKESLESDAFLYDALWSLWTGTVEQARKLPAGAIGRGIDGAPNLMAAAGGDMGKLALDARLVDGLKTRDELRAMLIERGVRDDKKKSFRQIGFNDYRSRQAPKSGGNAVGVVIAEGEISDGIEGPGKIGGRSTAELIRKARDDDRIKAIVLRVDSPGGSPFGSELVRRELELTQAAGKPVVVSMGDLAASGGYWISLAADEVIADAATITGSIGVVAMLPTAEGAMDKLRVRTGGYTTTWLAQGYDPRKALDPRFVSLVQSGIDRTYRDFTTRAAQSRKTTQGKIDQVAQGRVWTGAQALERGLVDRLGSYGDALKSAAARAKLGDDFRVSYIEGEPGRLDRVLDFFGASIARAIAGQLDDRSLAGGMNVPALAHDIRQDMRWLVGLAAEISEQRRPFAGVVHCFCMAQ